MASSQSASAPLAHFDQVNMCSVSDEGLQQVPVKGLIKGAVGGSALGAGALTGVRIDIVSAKHNAVIKVSKGRLTNWILSFLSFRTTA